jgi:hypothetical protein
MSVELVSDLDPPKTLKVNTKGLPPRRAELARLVAWRQAVTDELEKLAAGRRDLDAQHSHYDRGNDPRQMRNTRHPGHTDPDSGRKQQNY